MFLNPHPAELVLVAPFHGVELLNEPKRDIVGARHRHSPIAFKFLCLSDSPAGIQHSIRQFFLGDLVSRAIWIVFTLLLAQSGFADELSCSSSTEDAWAEAFSQGQVFILPQPLREEPDRLQALIGSTSFALDVSTVLEPKSEGLTFMTIQFKKRTSKQKIPLGPSARPERYYLSIELKNAVTPIDPIPLRFDDMRTMGGFRQIRYIGKSGHRHIVADVYQKARLSSQNALFGDRRSLIWASQYLNLTIQP